MGGRSRHGSCADIAARNGAVSVSPERPRPPPMTSTSTSSVATDVCEDPRQGVDGGRPHRHGRSLAFVHEGGDVAERRRSRLLAPSMRCSARRSPAPRRRPRASCRWRRGSDRSRRPDRSRRGGSRRRPPRRQQVPCRSGRTTRCRRRRRRRTSLRRRTLSARRDRPIRDGPVARRGAGGPGDRASPSSPRARRPLCHRRSRAPRRRHRRRPARVPSTRRRARRRPTAMLSSTASGPCSRPLGTRRSTPNPAGPRIPAFSDVPPTSTATTASRSTSLTSPARAEG